MDIEAHGRKEKKWTGTGSSRTLVRWPCSRSLLVQSVAAILVLIKALIYEIFILLISIGRMNEVVMYCIYLSSASLLLDLHGYTVFSSMYVVGFPNR